MALQQPQADVLHIRIQNGIAIATIHRPEAMNALNSSVTKALSDLLNWVEETSEAADETSRIRGVILTGAGEKAFVAGADIKQFESMSPADAAKFASDGQALFTRIGSMPVPVIAAVNGFALGGGLELALACDFIYASENAKFGLPECTLGLMPGFGGTVRLPRRIGPARARELAITGAMITAQEAFQMGLVNKVLPQAGLVDAALQTASLAASRAPLAVAMIKKSIYDGMNLSEAKANDLEAELFGELFATQDKIEGVKAFIEKRKPSFHGK